MIAWRRLWASGVALLNVWKFDKAILYLELSELRIRVWFRRKLDVIPIAIVLYKASVVSLDSITCFCQRNISDEWRKPALVIQISIDGTLLGINASKKSPGWRKKLTVTGTVYSGSSYSMRITQIRTKRARPSIKSGKPVIGGWMLAGIEHHNCQYYRNAQALGHFSRCSTNSLRKDTIGAYRYNRLR
jgi:hypothetical protein